MGKIVFKCLANEALGKRGELYLVEKKQGEYRFFETSFTGVEEDYDLYLKRVLKLYFNQDFFIARAFAVFNDNDNLNIYVFCVPRADEIEGSRTFPPPDGWQWVKLTDLKSEEFSQNDGYVVEDLREYFRGTREV